MFKINKILTISATTPINILTSLTAALVEADRKMGRKVNIQMAHGGTGLGYVMFAPVGVVPSAAAPFLIRELGPATSTAPGGLFQEESSNEGNRPELELEGYWIDGSHSGDTVIISIE